MLISCATYNELNLVPSRHYNCFYETLHQPYVYIALPLYRPYHRVAAALGMRVSTVQSIVHRSTTSRPDRQPASPAQPVIDSFTIGGIRRHIHAQFAAKQSFTLASLTDNLTAASIIPEGTTKTSLWRLLHKMGFRYRVSQRKFYVNKESMDIVCRRIRALRNLKRHREENRMIVYVDETWFTTRMSHNTEWVDSTQPVTSATYSRQVPPGDGERFVVVAAGTANGFIESSFLSFAAKNTTGDYHGEMNGELFIRWLTSQLLPALEQPAVLVMDNAPYHSQLTEESRCPTTATRKSDVIEWLEKRKIPFPQYATRPELLSISRENRPEPQYKVDNIIRSWGHEIIRLPPAHPELNAIEQVWGFMKRHVRSSLQRFTRADLQARLEEARLSVTEEVWEGAVRRSRSFEDNYCLADNIHESIDPVIIDLGGDSDDEDLSLSCDEN